MRYLVDISCAFTIDTMLMLFLPEKLITYGNNKLTKQVINLAIETILKFVARKIAAVTETQFVKHMEITNYFLKEKNLHKPPSTHVV